MKISLLLICALTLLTSCMGGYSNSMCQGRLKNLANLAGNYSIPELEQTLKITKIGTGTYQLGQDGQVIAELTSCVIKNKEIVEMAGDGVFIALERTGRDLNVTTFDTAVLDAAGVKYQVGESDEWEGVTIVAVEDAMTDDVFTKALIAGAMTLIKQ